MGKVKVEKDTSERWLLTYADLMNLLLIFFIILYTISKVDAVKFEQLAASLRKTLGDSSAVTHIGTVGGMPTILNFGSTGTDPVIDSQMEQEQMQQVKENVQKVVEQEFKNISDNIEVSVEERGVVISIKSNILFASGSSELENSAKNIIKEIGKILKLVPGKQIRVEGHTDNDPIKTSQFPSNWELSSARACNVLRYLVDKCGIDNNLISAVGYGEFRPRVENNSPSNKAYNRRVNIVIVRSIYDKAESLSVENSQNSNKTNP